MEYFLGIDDAGRGPIIGPMILSGVLLKKENLAPLKLLGVKDSKLVLQNKRVFLAKKIKECAVSYAIMNLSVDEIDSREKNGFNLNDLEALKMAQALNKVMQDLPQGEKAEVIVDCPSVNTQVWGDKLKSFIKQENLSRIKLKVEHKADFNYTECAAASILSKVQREIEVEKIKKEIKADFGSGYPSDPTTKKFLKERGFKFLKYGIIRQTWATWKNILKDSSQKKLF